MQVQVDASNTVLAWGLFPSPPADPTIRVVTIADAQVAHLREGGNKALQADGTITVQPLTSAQQADMAAAAAVAALITQHGAALAQLKPTLVGSSATMAADITAVQNLIASIEAGTQPTAAQVLQVLRFVLRVLAVLHT